MAYRLSLILLISIFSCRPKEPRTLTPAFYHWKTKFELNSKIQSDLQKTGIEKLYVRFFDIDWSEVHQQPTPKASVIFDSEYRNDFNIIPTVFITNRTFLNSTSEASENLAFDIAKKMKNDIKKHNLKPISEIQIDCDWSGKTREKYFRFLEIFKSQFKKELTLSATIRLHQIKFYENTGTPPVSRGILMFYNMSDVTNWNTQNSILDLAESEKYLYNFEKYPLELDLALPAYSWGVLFRDSEMIKLIPGIYSTDCQYFTNISPNRYKVDSSGYFEGHYLYKNDRLRLESAEPDDLLKAAETLSDLMKNPNLTVSFYHLHEHSFKRYSHENYLEILEKFKH